MRDGPIRPKPVAQPPAVDPLVGRVIAGKFAVQERLGSGAMGIVYRATQIALERPVAIKVLHREFAADSEFADRFWREAKAASRLDHPNSIRVLDFGQEPDGLLYLAMEYVEGCDLFDWLARRGPIAPRVIVELLSQVLAALAVAHDMGVVHRDLKPENVMIVRGKSDDGQALDLVKVCDFGIAKILDPAPPSSSEPRRKHSTTGLVVGTPAYMSPEQARGEKQDARSDLYAVGVMLYELLTGRVPFEAETLIGVALKHVSDHPERPSARAAGVDPALEAICLKAMSKRPADRYQSAREMRLALQQTGASGFVNELAASAPELAARPSAPLRRHDSSKPTLVGVIPVTPAPRAKRSRAWLALLLVPALAAALLVRFRASVVGERASVELTPSAPPAASVGSLASPTAEPRPEESAPAIDATGGTAHRTALGKPQRAKAEFLTRSAAVQESAPRDLPEPMLPAAASLVVAATPATPDAPAVPKAPPAPAASALVGPKYDLALARVTVGSAKNAVGATAASVTRAVSEATSRITACYKAALPGMSAPLEGAGTLHVDTDGAGVIVDARLSGPLRGSVPACVAAAVQGHRVANVDTGNASADVALSFRDH